MAKAASHLEGVNTIVNDSHYVFCLIIKFLKVTFLALFALAQSPISMSSDKQSSVAAPQQHQAWLSIKSAALQELASTNMHACSPECCRYVAFVAEHLGILCHHMFG